MNHFRARDNLRNCSIPNYTGTFIKYNPVNGTDTMVKNGVCQTISTRLHCITSMKVYESKSLEELRLEDYSAGRKRVTQGFIKMNQMTRFRARDNRELVEHLRSKGVIKSQEVFDTMNLVDRGKFVNNFNPYNDAYIDAPQSIGHGRTISAPHMHAVVLENLSSKLKNAKKALAVRCSAGYVTTCMALMIGPKGFVVNVESNPELYDKIKKNIENGFSYLLENKRIHLFMGNEGYGYPLQASYDIIYIGAAAENVPQTFIDQLAVGGRLIMPVGPKDGDQVLMQIDKYIGGNIIKTPLLNVKYGYLNMSQPIIFNKFEKNFVKSAVINNIVRTAENESEPVNNEINPTIMLTSRENLKSDVKSTSVEEQSEALSYNNSNGNTSKLLETKKDIVIKDEIDTKDYKIEPLFMKLSCPGTFETKVGKSTGINETRDIKGTVVPITKPICHQGATALFNIKAPLAERKTEELNNEISSVMKTTLDKSCKLDIKPTDVKHVKLSNETSEINEKMLQLLEIEKDIIIKDEIDTKDYIVKPIIRSPVPGLSTFETKVGKNIGINETRDIKGTVVPIAKPIFHQGATALFNIKAPLAERKTEELNNEISSVMKTTLDKSCKLDIKPTDVKNVKLSNETNGTNDKMLQLLETKRDITIHEKIEAKYRQIEPRITDLENKITKILQKFSEIEAEKNELFQTKLDNNEFKLNIEKWKERIENKIASLEKDIQILGKKLNKKILKVKGIDEQLKNKNDKQDQRLEDIENIIALIAEEIRIIEIRYDEKIVKEKAIICEQANEELEIKLNMFREELKEKQAKKFLPSKESYLQHSNLAFCLILTLHATFVITKKFF